MYTQVGLAFIAGVCFASALIPLNRYLANKIHSFSEGLMTAKDARISLATEALTGAKQIKLLSWEDVFIEKIQGSPVGLIGPSIVCSTNNINNLFQF